MIVEPKMVSEFMCKKCKKTHCEPHKEFEYIFQEKGKCTCGGATFISSIYVEYPKSKEEIKFDKWIDQWR